MAVNKYLVWPKSLKTCEDRRRAIYWMYLVSNGKGPVYVNEDGSDKEFIHSIKNLLDMKFLLMGLADFYSYSDSEKKQLGALFKACDGGVGYPVPDEVYQVMNGLLETNWFPEPIQLVVSICFKDENYDPFVVKGKPVTANSSGLNNFVHSLERKLDELEDQGVKVEALRRRLDGFNAECRRRGLFEVTWTDERQTSRDDR